MLKYLVFIYAQIYKKAPDNSLADYGNYLDRINDNNRPPQRLCANRLLLSFNKIK